MPNTNNSPKLLLHFKWYWNPILWFLFGAAFTFVSTFVADMLISGRYGHGSRA